MEKIVTGCPDCPFSVMYDTAPGYGCRIIRDEPNNARIKMNKMFMPITPKWCPLKKELITISIKQP